MAESTELMALRAVRKKVKGVNYLNDFLTNRVKETLSVIPYFANNFDWSKFDIYYGYFPKDGYTDEQIEKIAKGFLYIKSNSPNKWVNTLDVYGIGLLSCFLTREEYNEYNGTLYKSADDETTNLTRIKSWLKTKLSSGLRERYKNKLIAHGLYNETRFNKMCEVLGEKSSTFFAIRLKDEEVVKYIDPSKAIVYIKTKNHATLEDILTTLGITSEIRNKTLDLLEIDNWKTLLDKIIHELTGRFNNTKTLKYNDTDSDAPINYISISFSNLSASLYTDSIAEVVYMVNYIKPMIRINDISKSFAPSLFLIDFSELEKKIFPNNSNYNGSLIFKLKFMTDKSDYDDSGADDIYNNDIAVDMSTSHFVEDMPS